MRKPLWRASRLDRSIRPAAGRRVQLSQAPGSFRQARGY